MRQRRLVTDERGSAATELTLLVPALIALMLFVVFCGRAADARLRVNDAAHQAVRAATLARSAPQASHDASTTAQTALSDAGVTCLDATVDTQLAGFQPGSTITVVLTCRIGLTDLALLRLPGSITIAASSSAVIDTWRGTTVGTT
jgi:Flp pilus assembly protein TadG